MECRAASPPSVECTIKDLGTLVSDHSSLINTAREEFHPAMRCGYELCLELIFSKVSGRGRNYEAVSDLDVDMQLGAYE